MSVFPKPGELFGSYYGFLVTGGAKALPASGKGSIFTVVGGRVVITSLIGTVTTSVQNQACTLAAGNTPTGGTAAVASLASAGSIIAASVGTIVSVPALSALGSGQPLLVGSSGSTSPVGTGSLPLVAAGTIDVTTSATNTGAITYSITYIPYDAGATITAL